MELVDAIYDDVRASLLSELSPLSWQVHRDEGDSAFRSRYIELHRRKGAVRFVWDAKESWFVLERCMDLPLAPHPKWTDVLFERVKLSELDSEMAEQLSGRFREAISKIASEDQAA